MAPAPVPPAPPASPPVVQKSGRDLRFFVAAALLGIAAGIALGVKLAKGQVEYVRVPAAPPPCRDCEDRKAEALRASQQYGTSSGEVPGGASAGSVGAADGTAPQFSEESNGAKVFSPMDRGPDEVPDDSDFAMELRGAMGRAHSHGAVSQP
jgi:hypothetical protein